MTSPWKAPRCLSPATPSSPPGSAYATWARPRPAGSPPSCGPAKGFPLPRQRGAARGRRSRTGPGRRDRLSLLCQPARRADADRGRAVGRCVPARDPVRSQVIFPLEDSASTARIVKVSPDPPERTILAPAPSPLTSDVDRFVPSGITARPDALAVVLGVGSYDTAPEARFAAEDARTAARYFEHALGIPACAHPAAARRRGDPRASSTGSSARTAGWPAASTKRPRCSSSSPATAWPSSAPSCPTWSRRMAT